MERKQKKDMKQYTGHSPHAYIKSHYDTNEIYKGDETKEKHADRICRYINAPTGPSCLHTISLYLLIHKKFVIYPNLYYICIYCFFSLRYKKTEDVLLVRILQWKHFAEKNRQQHIHDSVSGTCSNGNRRKD